MNIMHRIRDLFMDTEIKRKVHFFQKMTIFKNLDNIYVGKLLNIAYRKEYEPGEIIFNEQDIGKALFIIMSGEVEIIKGYETKSQQILSTLSEGEFFGEMALIEELPRSATVRTVKKSEILIIYKSNFDVLIERSPRLGLSVIRNLTKIICKRLRKMSEKCP